MTVASRNLLSPAFERAGLTWAANPKTAIEAAIIPKAVAALAAIDAVAITRQR